MEWEEEEKQEEREIPPEELRKEMYRCLVSKHIVTEKDLKTRVEEQPELDNFAKATSYILENHKGLFKLFKKSDAYYEAVKLARRLVEDEIIVQHDEQFHCTPYYFEKSDIKTRNAIDSQLIKYFPKAVIPTKHPLIRKEIKVESNPKLFLDDKVEKSEELRIEPEFITVSKYLIQNHPELFANLTTSGSTSFKANYIAEILAEEGVISKSDKSYHNSRLYFRREAVDIMDRIDYAISKGVVEKARANTY